MSAAKPLPSRYVWLKAVTALEAALSGLAAKSAAGARLSLPESASYVVSQFKEAYKRPLTTVMYMAGAAMAPGLNKFAQEDKDSIEKLVGSWRGRAAAQARRGRRACRPRRACRLRPAAACIRKARPRASALAPRLR
jgi:hypothetical protein